MSKISFNSLIKKEEQKTTFITISLISANIITILYTLHGGLTPLELLIILGYTMFSFLSTVRIAFTDLNKIVITTLIISTLVLTGIVFVFQDSMVIYSDDCKELTEIEHNISLYNCVNYIIENPDSTGNQVIEALIPEQTITEKEQPVSILDRQFNP